MNIDLENGICPVCKAKLFTDEVAFCPECGAPHHKKCFNSLGHCFYADSHGKENQPQFEKVPLPNANVEEETKNAENEKEKEKASSENPFFKINGLDPNEDLGGASVKETASFIGYNALRYIKIFKRMKAKNSKVSWNWLGFLFPEYWLISRKMYAPAILRSILSALSLICVNFVNYDTFAQNILNINPILLDWILILAGISLAFNIIIGLFGDYFYKNHTVSKIKSLKEEGNSSEVDYIRAGSVNIFLPILLYFGIEAFATIVLMFLK